MTERTTRSRPAPDKAATKGIGILPVQALTALAADGVIDAEESFAADQIQPASLDLRLGPVAYRIRASFLPGPSATVAEKLAQFKMHEMDLSRGAVLEVGCVYLVPLMERVRLPADVSGIANPKSSTGRLDVFTRLIVDRASEFDRIGPSYEGPLYAEISPRTFSVLVKPGSRLNQLRLRRGDVRFGRDELFRLQRDERLVGGTDAEIADGVALSVDLSGRDSDGGIVGYRAKRHAPVVDMEHVGGHDPRDYWEPITPRGGRNVILDPNEFYILHSKETVHVPPDTAAEMVPIDPLVGEFRVHYAGFFDPGFGNEDVGGEGSRAVLEVRSHEVPFVLEDGQKVGRLIYEPMSARPARLYGETGSHYQSQGLKLSKHFERW